MPKIILKPNSPEYAEKELKRTIINCEMPGCTEIADHKAPKDRGLNEHYNFCLDHIREYNKAWNFFSGMSNEEVHDHMAKSRYGDRPTWRYGVDGDAEETLQGKAWGTYKFTDKEPPKDKKGNVFYGDRNTPEYEAMALFALEPPLSQKEIRARYMELVKKHHPDINQGCEKSEELLKQINMAYTILKLACEKFETLSDRD